MSALNNQVGGNHYTKLKIQPLEYSLANKLDGGQHTVIKYVTRWRDKDGMKDLKKALHTLQLYIELMEKEDAEAEKKRAEAQAKVALQAQAIRDEFDPFSRDYWAAPEPTIKAYMEHDGPGGLMTNRGFGPISTASITGR